MLNVPQREMVPLTRDEIGALLAALNFTKNRTAGISWLSTDEDLRLKLMEIAKNFGVIKS